MADIKERDTVRLARDWLATVTLPMGYTGTVVHVHPSGGFEVEFTDGEEKGRGVLLGLPASMVERVDPLSTQAFERWNAGFMATPIGDDIDAAIILMQTDGHEVPPKETVDNIKRALALLAHSKRAVAWQKLALAAPGRLDVSERIRNSRPLGKVSFFKDLDVVRLKSALPGGGEWTNDPDLPAGAVGTIVHVHDPCYQVEFTDDDGKTLRVAGVLEHDLERVPPLAPGRLDVSERIRNSRPLGKVILAAELVANQWALGDSPSEESLEALHKAIEAHNDLQKVFDRCKDCGRVVCECSDEAEQKLLADRRTQWIVNGIAIGAGITEQEARDIYAEAIAKASEP